MTHAVLKAKANAGIEHGKFAGEKNPKKNQKKTSKKNVNDFGSGKYPYEPVTAEEKNYPQKRKHVRRGNELRTRIQDRFVAGPMSHATLRADRVWGDGTVRQAHLHGLKV